MTRAGGSSSRSKVNTFSYSKKGTTIIRSAYPLSDSERGYEPDKSHSDHEEPSPKSKDVSPRREYRPTLSNKETDHKQMQDEVDEEESRQYYDMEATRHQYGRSTSGVNIEDAPAEEESEEE